MANRRNIILGAGAVAAIAVAGGAYWAFGQQSSSGGATAVEGAVPTAPGATVPMDQLMAIPAGIKDHALGPDTARVVFIEYLSPTCPHCAAFANTVYPDLKAQYVDTGKIRFIPRPFARNIQDAVVFMLAEAAGEAKYHDVIATYFKTQDQWVTSPTPDDAIFKIAQQLGFTKETYDAALTNQTLFTAIEAMRDQAVKSFHVQGTPTFYINGKMLTGEQTIDGLKKEIDPLLG